MADVEKVLELAVRAAGMVGADRLDWRRRLFMAIGDIVGVFNEHSDEWSYAARLADSSTKSVLVARYMGHRPADRANRLVVTLQARDREPEEMYTPWLDSMLGQAMQAKLATIQMGAEVRVWKDLEEWAPPDAKPGVTHKMRVMINVEPIAADDGPTASAPSAARPVAAPSKGDSAGAAADPVKQEMLDNAFERLSGPERVKLAQWGREKGILNTHQPGDRIDDVLKRCEEIAAARSQP